MKCNKFDCCKGTAFTGKCDSCVNKLGFEPKETPITPEGWDSMQHYYVDGEEY